MVLVKMEWVGGLYKFLTLLTLQLSLYFIDGYLDLHLTLLTQTHPNMVLVKMEGVYTFLTLLTLQFFIYFIDRGI